MSATNAATPNCAMRPLTAAVASWLRRMASLPPIAVDGPSMGHVIGHLMPDFGHRALSDAKELNGPSDRVGLGHSQLEATIFQVGQEQRSRPSAFVEGP